MPRRPTPHYPDFAKRSLTVSPSWVWDRAVDQVSRKCHVSIPRDGEDVARVMRYLRADMHGHCGHWRFHRHEDPDIHSAVKFSNDLAMTSNTAVLQLKCNVLARRSIGWLATTYAVSRPVMRTYLKTYFDVQERLDHRDYIIHQVIRMAPDIPPGAYELAMLHSYEMGPEAVEPWVDWFSTNTEKHDLSTPEGRRREALSLAVEAQWSDLTPSRALHLQVLIAKTPELVRKMFRTRSPGVQIAELHASKLASLNFLPCTPRRNITSSEANAAAVPDPCEVVADAGSGQPRMTV